MEAYPNKKNNILNENTMINQMQFQNETNYLNQMNNNNIDINNYNYMNMMPMNNFYSNNSNNINIRMMNNYGIGMSNYNNINMDQIGVNNFFNKSNEGYDFSNIHYGPMMQKNCPTPEQQMMAPNPMMETVMKTNESGLDKINYKMDNMNIKNDDNKYSSIINVTFCSSSEEIPSVYVQTTLDEKVSVLIKKYRNKLGDHDPARKFIFNAKN